jgi:hypothetical protein
LRDQTAHPGQIDEEPDRQVAARTDAERVDGLVELARRQVVADKGNK